MKKWTWALAVCVGLCAALAHASAPQKVTFNQSMDCALVDHWDLFASPGTSISLPGVKVATLVNNATTGTCGSPEVQTEPVVGVGSTTLWMVAVAADGTTSPASNGVTVSLPLGAPVLVSVTN